MIGSSRESAVYSVYHLVLSRKVLGSNPSRGLLLRLNRTRISNSVTKLMLWNFLEILTISMLMQVFLALMCGVAWRGGGTKLILLFTKVHKFNPIPK